MYATVTRPAGLAAAIDTLLKTATGQTSNQIGQTLVGRDKSPSYWYLCLKAQRTPGINTLDRWVHNWNEAHPNGPELTVWVTGGGFRVTVVTNE